MRFPQNLLYIIAIISFTHAAPSYNTRVGTNGETGPELYKGAYNMQYGLANNDSLVNLFFKGCESSSLHVRSPHLDESSLNETSPSSSLDSSFWRPCVDYLQIIYWQDPAAVYFFAITTILWGAISYSYLLKFCEYLGVYKHFVQNNNWFVNLSVSVALICLAIFQLTIGAPGLM